MQQNLKYVADILYVQFYAPNDDSKLHLGNPRIMIKILLG